MAFSHEISLSEDRMDYGTSIRCIIETPLFVLPSLPNAHKPNIQVTTTHKLTSNLHTELNPRQPATPPPKSHQPCHLPAKPPPTSSRLPPSTLEPNLQPSNYPTKSSKCQSSETISLISFCLWPFKLSPNLPAPQTLLASLVVAGLALVKDPADGDGGRGLALVAPPPLAGREARDNLKGHKQKEMREIVSDSLGEYEWEWN